MVSKSNMIIITSNKYEALSDCLSEKGKRLWAATEAIAYGHGGISLVCEATGLARSTIHRGIKELRNAEPPSPRIRKAGGGRKKKTESEKELSQTVEELVNPSSLGDPESPLKWTSKSIRKLTDELINKGYHISIGTTARILKDLGYSLQVNKKTLGGSSHKDRDAQFQYISKKIIALQSKGLPTVSVDTKKKENIGPYKNNGREYSLKRDPVKVKSHSFPDKQLGKVVPYGVYDIGGNKGWVSVGISADTAEFAVHSIRTWWYKMGVQCYPKATELLITADCGGSNGYRVRLWKSELQKLSSELGMIIHVHHFPPGTSKWNKIEHRLFSYISKNWRGKPLINRETVVNLIGNTRTKAGLKTQAVLDENTYKKGIKISDKAFKALNIIGDDFHPEWNYSIYPKQKM